MNRRNPKFFLLLPASECERVLSNADGVVWGRWIDSHTGGTPPNPTVPGGTLDIVGCQKRDYAIEVVVCYSVGADIVYYTFFAALIYIVGEQRRTRLSEGPHSR